MAPVCSSQRLDVAPDSHPAHARRQTALRDIELLVLDVDGVLTDGRLHYDAQGAVSKAFHVRDGLGLAMLRMAGVEVGIITGRSDPATHERLLALRIAQPLVLQGCHDKGEGLRRLASQAGLELSRIAYMGDDVIDLAALELAGFAACPADAHSNVLRAAHWVARHSGGHGAVRELAEALLRVKGFGAALESGAGFTALLQANAVQ